MKDRLESLSASERHIWLTTYAAKYAASGSFHWSVQKAEAATIDFRAWMNWEEIPSEEDDGYPM